MPNFGGSHLRQDFFMETKSNFSYFNDKDRSELGLNQIWRNK